MGDFKELLVQFLNSQVLVYMLYAYLYALVFYMVYSMLNYFKYHSRMKATLQSLYNQMSEQEKMRADEERRQRDLHGAGTKVDFLGRLDERLAYSGIKDKFKWMTTEIYLLFVIMVVVLVVTVVVLIKGVLWGIVSGILTVLVLDLMLVLVVARRNASTESVMLQFMNIIDNFSKTSDDLISIMEKSSRYVDAPLGPQIYDAVIEAKNSGDTVQAIQSLQDKVKNKHFKVLMRNLEISSRYEANYSEIVEDCRDIFHNYIKSEKEKRNIRLNGLAEIGTMLVIGFACTYLLGSMTEEGNLIEALNNGGAMGKGILVYLVVSIVASLYVLIFKVFRNNK